MYKLKRGVFHVYVRSTQEISIDKPHCSIACKINIMHDENNVHRNRKIGYIINRNRVSGARGRENILSALFNN